MWCSYAADMLQIYGVVALDIPQDSLLGSIVKMPKLSWLLCIVASFVSCTIAESPSTSTDGIKGLANRLLGSRAGDFAFTLTEEHEKYSRWNQPKNDNYTVSQDNGKIHIQGTTLSALARGYGRRLSQQMIQVKLTH